VGIVGDPYRASIPVVEWAGSQKKAKMVGVGIP